VVVVEVVVVMAVMVLLLLEQCWRGAPWRTRRPWAREKQQHRQQ